MIEIEAERGKGIPIEKDWFEELIEQADGLQVLFDRAKVKAALGRAELRDLVRRAGTDLEVVRSEVKRLRLEASAPSADIKRNLRQILEGVGRTLDRIAERT